MVQVARCALQIARSTCSANWVSDVFTIYTRARAPMSATILADLQATVPLVRPIHAEALHDYLDIVGQITTRTDGAMLQRSLEALVGYAQ